MTIGKSHSFFYLLLFGGQKVAKSLSILQGNFFFRFRSEESRIMIAN